MPLTAPTAKAAALRGKVGMPTPPTLGQKPGFFTPIMNALPKIMEQRGMGNTGGSPVDAASPGGMDQHGPLAQLLGNPQHMTALQNLVKVLHDLFNGS